MQNLKIISFTYKTVPLADLGKFFIDEETRSSRLAFLKEDTGIDELFYLATCNRFEFIFTTVQEFDQSFLRFFLKKLNAGWSKEEIEFAVNHARVYEGDLALHHIFSVASSLDSMVVGEREIITQVRKSYDESNESGLTGDFLRLVMRSTVTTAKRVFTETKIATHPVSVVSLAYRKLRDMNVKLGSKILMIGAGETNANLLKYLVKHGFSEFSIFNRTLANAEKLAASIESDQVHVKSFPLSELQNYKGGFDVLITCTAASEPLVTSEVYGNLLNEDSSSKVVIDLAMPSDVEPAVIEKYNIHLIDISRLNVEAGKNLAERHHELKAAETILGESIMEFHQVLRLRKLELAMKEVPGKIREIKSKAINDVFAREISMLDESSRDLIGKMLDYMEKKCISVPMMMAKEIILDSK
ncbi:MAG: glutamyl-tRNA reductase [Bacteroidetes bacterium]|nr:glutamyl-tRNA reductase [Bacteroidota bacterium]